MNKHRILIEPYVWAVEDNNPYVDLIRSYIRNELNTQLHYLAHNYIQLNTIARRRYMEFIELAGSMLDLVEPASMSPQSRVQLLEALDSLDEASSQLKSHAEQRRFAQSKETVHFDKRTIDNMDWRSKGQNVYQARVQNIPATKYWRVDPNSASHQPKHKRTEYILIVDGALGRDDRYFGSGSLYISPAGDKEQLPACPERGCIYLNVSDQNQAGLAALISHLLKS